MIFLECKSLSCVGTCLHLLESPQVTLQLQHYQGEAHVMLHSVPEADVQYSAMK